MRIAMPERLGRRSPAERYLHQRCTVARRPACHNFKLPGGLRAAWGLSNESQGEGTDG